MSAIIKVFIRDIHRSRAKLPARSFVNFTARSRGNYAARSFPREGICLARSLASCGPLARPLFSHLARSLGRSLACPAPAARSPARSRVTARERSLASALGARFLPYFPSSDAKRISDSRLTRVRYEYRAPKICAGLGFVRIFEIRARACAQAICLGCPCQAA